MSTTNHNNNENIEQQLLQNNNIYGMHHSASITGVADFYNNKQNHVSDGVAATATAIESHDQVSPQQEGLTNVASADKGARVLFATDEWFAVADNLLKDCPAVFDPDAYCEQGKVMDGWESRRRREAGHDWCIVKLAGRACISAIEIDTAHFTGNHVPQVSLQVADLSRAQETALVSAFPGALERLLHGGGVQGTGMTPAQVDQAEQACQKVTWKTLLPKTPLQPGYQETSLHYSTLEKQAPVVGTLLRVNYYPDGGVARLRLWGRAAATDSQQQPSAGQLYSPALPRCTCTVVSHCSSNNESELPSRQPFDSSCYKELSLQKNGGVGLACSNKHYGDPWNLIQSSAGRDMGDGWETARHPERPAILVTDPKTGLVDSDLSDWCILKLGEAADRGVARIILDTKHFRGNYPESVQVEGCYVQSDDDLLTTASAGVDDDNADDTVEWFPLIQRSRMAPDAEHVFDRCKEQIMNADKAVSHVKVRIYPDGGISRVRIYG